MNRRLADLRVLITSHLDEDEPEVRMVIRMIDNKDVAGLKMVLTEETRRRFGFMDEEAKSGNGAGTSGGKDRVSVNFDGNLKASHQLWSNYSKPPTPIHQFSFCVSSTHFECYLQAKDKQESKSVRDMKRLAQAIRGGITAEIEETVKTVTGNRPRVPAFMSGYKQASADARDHDADKTVWHPQSFMNSVHGLSILLKPLLNNNNLFKIMPGVL